MRKYFWKKDDIELITYTDKYEDVINRKPEEDDICFVILDTYKEYVGYISLNWINIRGGSTGIYVEISEGNRRKGYGTSAMEIMLEYAFDEMRLHKVQAASKANAIGNEQFLYHLGFVYEAYRSNMFLEDGIAVAEDYYGMTEAEFRNENRTNRKQAEVPFNYKTPIFSNFAVKEKDDKYTYSYINYEKVEDFYICNGLKFRGMTREDCLKNNEIIFDSAICRLYDDEVKMPGFTDVVDEFALSHLNYGMEDNRLEFAIEDHGKYMGCVNLCGIDRENHRTSASIYLTPESRGKGIGGRALQFAYSFAAKEFDCPTFFTCVSHGNLASARMMYKLGMRMTGVQREAAFVGGQYVDTLFFEGPDIIWRKI